MGSKMVDINYSGSERAYNFLPPDLRVGLARLLSEGDWKLLVEGQDYYTNDSRGFKTLHQIKLERSGWRFLTNVVPDLDCESEGPVKRLPRPRKDEEIQRQFEQTYGPRNVLITQAHMGNGTPAPTTWRAVYTKKEI